MPGAGFEQRVERASLRDRVLQFLSSNEYANLREVSEAVDEEASVVVHCLRRLWKSELILRTAKPVYQFEACQKGRAGVSCHVRAVNYYVLNNGHEIPSQFVSYESRKKEVEAEKWRVRRVKFSTS